jgi:hypothetical protein
LVRSRKGLPRAYERASKNATNTNHVCLRCHHVLYLASGSMSPVFCNATRVPEEFCLFVAFLDRRDTQRSHPCSQLRGSRPWTTSTQQSRTESWSRHGEDCRSRGKRSTGCLSSTRLPMTTSPGPVRQGPQERPARHSTSSDLSKREASLGEKHPGLVGRMLNSRIPRAPPRESDGDGGRLGGGSRPQHPEQERQPSHLLCRLDIKSCNSSTWMRTTTCSRSILV